MMLQRLKLLFDRLWAALACPGGVHYVSGAQSLPPPLTPEEEKQLLARMMAGDAAARDELITHNLRLVVYLAKKYESSGVPQEDMISIGTIGLIKAVNTFTPERNIKLATYASRCIGNEILMYLRKSSNRRQEASIDEPLNIDGDGNELLLSDVLGSDENQVGLRLEQDAERATLRRSVERLNPRERQIMELRFGLVDGVERTQKEAADAIGISQSYISRLEKRIIRDLRKQLEETTSPQGPASAENGNLFVWRKLARPAKGSPIGKTPPAGGDGTKVPKGEWLASEARLRGLTHEWNTPSPPILPVKSKRNRRAGDVQQSRTVRRQYRGTAGAVRAGKAPAADPGAGRGPERPPEHDRGQPAAGAQRGAAVCPAGARTWTTCFRWAASG